MIKINCRAWYRKPNGKKCVVLITGYNAGNCFIVGDQVIGSVAPEELEAIDTESPISNECYKCGKEATVLCDGLVRNFKKMGIKPLGEPYETCDRPMCENCVAYRSNPLIFCGKEGGVTYNDYCDRCESIRNPYLRSRPND